MKHDDCHFADWISYLTIGMTDNKPDIVSGPLKSNYEKCATHEQLWNLKTIDLSCALPYPRGRYLFVAVDFAHSSHWFGLTEVEVYDGKLAFLPWKYHTARLVNLVILSVMVKSSTIEKN